MLEDLGSEDDGGWRVPQLLDLLEAIAAADDGDFASQEEVDAWFARHGA